VFQVGEHEIVIEKEGFIPKIIKAKILPNIVERSFIELTPVAFGLLHNKIFIVDLEDGGPRGSMGVKAEDVNMGVALFLRGYLEGAGARVYLTRERSKNPSPTTKIMMVERFGAERFLSIGHGGAADPTFNSTFVLHYPNSKLGIALAKEIQQHLVAALKHKDGGIRGSTLYSLVHTSVPAIYITPLSSQTKRKRRGLPILSTLER
jgi:hypothetical protein